MGNNCAEQLLCQEQPVEVRTIMHGKSVAMWHRSLRFNFHVAYLILLAVLSSSLKVAAEGQAPNAAANQNPPAALEEIKPLTGLDNTPQGGSLPGGTVPGGTLPGGTLPGGTVPGGTLPGGTIPGGPLPGGTLPGGTLPGGTVPGGTLPGGPL